MADRWEVDDGMNGVVSVVHASDYDALAAAAAFALESVPGCPGGVSRNHCWRCRLSDALLDYKRASDKGTADGDNDG